MGKRRSVGRDWRAFWSALTNAIKSPWNKIRWYDVKWYRVSPPIYTEAELAVMPSFDPKRYDFTRRFSSENDLWLK
jgi:hypothetical protein